MATSVPVYRMFLNETLRKHLGINLKNKKIYIFKVKHKTYISTDMVPKSTSFKILNVILGSTCWFIDIPASYVEQEPSSYRLLNTKGKVIEIY